MQSCKSRIDAASICYDCGSSIICDLCHCRICTERVDLSADWYYIDDRNTFCDSCNYRKRRIKELKEQLGYEEIGLDDIFVFHCTQCGKCCIHREDILLSPKDLFHIAKKLKITPEVALAQYCETYLGRNSHIPVVRLKPHGSVKRCPLLKNQKCLVHDVKPAVCAMFPIGRYLALPSDGIFPENPEELSVGYVFNDPECGDRSETHTVREWFHKFNIPLKDDYFFAWTKTKATLSKHLRFLEGRLSEKTMVSIWNATLITLYLNYEVTEDFQTQFQKNSDMLLSLIEKLRTADAPMPKKI